MHNCNQIDLNVRDVQSPSRFFRDVAGLILRVNKPRFAELDGGSITSMLSPEALVPVQHAAGIILHIQVDDVILSLQHARNQGATVLLEPTQTDWGTESAMIPGPEGFIIDFFRPAQA